MIPLQSQLSRAFALISLPAIAIAAFAVSPAAISAEFTETGERVFMRSCTASFNDSRFTREQKERICQCVLDGFKEDSVSNEDVSNFTANSQDPSQWSPSIRRVMSSCAPN